MNVAFAILRRFRLSFHLRIGTGKKNHSNFDSTKGLNVNTTKVRIRKPPTYISMWPFVRDDDGNVTIAVRGHAKILTFRLFSHATVEHDEALLWHCDVWCFETSGVGKRTCAQGGFEGRALSACERVWVDFLLNWMGWVTSVIWRICYKYSYRYCTIFRGKFQNRVIWIQIIILNCGKIIKLFPIFKMVSFVLLLENFIWYFSRSDKLIHSD